jgi:ketol-acid reductoisomerase
MAARRAPQVLRASLAQVAKAPLAGARVATVLTARTASAVTQRAAVAGPFQQTRGMKTIDFAGTKETVFGELLVLCN